MQAVSVVKGLKGARLGQVGVRPGTFETVAYDEAQLIKKFGQNVIYTEISDIVRVAEGYADDDPEVVRIMGEIRSGVAKVAVADDYVLKAAKLELALTLSLSRTSFPLWACSAGLPSGRSWASLCALSMGA